MSYLDCVNAREDKVLAPSRVNRDVYGKYIMIPKRAFDDPNLNKNPILF